MEDDRVLVKQPRKNELSSPFNSYPYQPIPIPIAQKSSMFTAKNFEIDHEITQNETHFKSIPKQAITPSVISDSEGEGKGIARVDSNLELDLMPVSPPNNQSINIENTIPPREVSPRRFRCPVDEWFEY